MPWSRCTHAVSSASGGHTARSSSPYCASSFTMGYICCEKEEQRERVEAVGADGVADRLRAAAAPLSPRAALPGRGAASQRAGQPPPPRARASPACKARARAPPLPRPGPPRRATRARVLSRPASSVGASAIQPARGWVGGASRCARRPASFPPPVHPSRGRIEFEGCPTLGPPR